MSMVEVSVPNLDCEGCASKLRKALFNLKGVEEVDIDMEIQKITVTGYRLEEKKVLKTIKNAGKAAEPWPYPYPPYPYPGYSYLAHHYDTSRNADDQSINTLFKTPAADYLVVVDSIFSDDNPHACTIM